jgi:glycosyltransferase involved in cell wall biosynthesis
VDGLEVAGVTNGARFVCAFRGARDSYQTAVALAEGDLLEELITDAYATPAAMRQRWLPARLRARLAERHADGLPPERVHALWATTVLEHTRHALGFAPRQTWLKLDAQFGEAAADWARRARANLLMYSPYAWEAFTASYAHAPKRVLFQYHPHPDLEARIIGNDRQHFPGFGESFSGDDEITAAEHLARRERDAWRHADAIICSSTFTRRSLIEAGCDERACHVVPYGIDLSPEPPPAGFAGPFEVVFVGSGGRRKGLHHLLLAWQRAALPPGSRLTLVCRVIDRSIRELATATKGVHIRHDVDAAERDAVYGRSHLMVMASLVEGFGQVYLESLARGCPVLGTPNSGLPDLGGEGDGIFVAAAGDVAQLTARLEGLATMIPARPELRAAARATAARFPWAMFRRRIREVAVQ